MPTRQRRAARPAAPPACRCTPYPYATYRHGTLVAIERRHHGKCTWPPEPLDPATYQPPIPTTARQRT